MLEVTGAQYRYGRESLDTPPAVAGVTLSITPGQLVGLLGQNGSGKSTLAKMLAGVFTPQAGEIMVDGIDTRDQGRRWEARRLVGLVFQNPDDQLIANTLIDDVAFGPENLGLPRDEIQRRVDSAIELMGLKPFLTTPLNELSVGQRQRVAIAGVLAMEPRYIVLDEPSTMLPPSVTDQLLATVTQLARTHGIGVIYITHRMEEVVSFDHVAVMHRGVIALEGAPRSVFGAVERLHELGLDAPSVTLLARRLRAHGYDVQADSIRAEEIATQLRVYTNMVDDEPAGRAKRETSISGGSSMEPPGLGKTSKEQTKTASPPLLETRNLSFTRLRGTPFAQQVLNGLDSQIQPGAFVAFVGPTRSGKSTLLDCLNAIIKPGKGMVFYNGADMGEPGFDLEKLRRAVGVVYQSPDSQILEDIVGKDVAFGLIRRKIPLAESRRIVQESLEAVGLPYEEFRNRYTYALSGGEKRRVAIAGALAMYPETLALDEPTAGLDPQGRSDFIALIQRLRREQALTVVYMTSSLDDVVSVADYIYVLDAGAVAFHGTPREILRQLPELDRLGVGLSSVSRLALVLSKIVPDMDTACLDLDELEGALLTQLQPSSSVTQAPRQETAQ
jgi:energy-coupling factor transporter ATPase